MPVRQMTPNLSDIRDGMPFLGGTLWLDLLNTTPVIAGQPADLISDSAKLQHWQRLAGAGDTASDLAQTLALRAALRPMVDHLAVEQPLPAPLVALINGHLAGAPLTRQLDVSQTPPQLVEHPAPLSLPQVCALDFARFLGDFEPQRLKHCQNPACTMVFYDHGRNNRRRWCSATACGNRDKVANYRARKATQGR